MPHVKDTDIDLTVCGHAHGGIIRLPFTDGLIGPQREWFPDYTNGIYTETGGKLIGIRPTDIAGLFYNEGGAPKGSVGDIKIFLKHSLIEVSPELAPQLCERLATCNICGYEVNIREDKGIPGQDAGPRVNVRDRRTRKDADRREHGSRFERAERYSAPRREKFDRYEGAGKDGGFRKRFDRAPRQEADAFYTKFAGSKKPRKK